MKIRLAPPSANAGIRAAASLVAGMPPVALMTEALPLGNMNEIHGYARQLLAAGKTTEASTVFKFNYKKFPNTFTTNMGMARAFSSEGNYKEALKYATAALPQAPDPANPAGGTYTAASVCASPSSCRNPWNTRTARRDSA